MKFHQLPLGERFEYDGECYVKSAPLIARHDESGKQRVIPRSAVVQRFERGASTDPQEPAVPLSAQAVRAALERYHATCLDGLARIAAGEEKKEALAQLEEAKARFCRELAL